MTAACHWQLKGGQLVIVPSILVPRQKQHFSAVEQTGERPEAMHVPLEAGAPIREERSCCAGVSLVMGVNGLVWVGWDSSKEDKDPASMHEEVARAANAVRVLSKLSFAVTPRHIAAVYQVGRPHPVSAGGVLRSGSQIENSALLCAGSLERAGAHPRDAAPELSPVRLWG